MTKAKLLVYVFCGFMILMLPGLLADFKASETLQKYSKYFGGILAFVSFLLYLAIIKQTTKNKLKILIAVSLSIGMFGYGAGVGSIGFTINRIMGIETSSIHTIKTKGCHSKKCLCRTEVMLTTDSKMTNGTFCIAEDLWNQVRVGQKLELSGVSSIFGFDVDEIKTIRKQAHADGPFHSLRQWNGR